MVRDLCLSIVDGLWNPLGGRLRLTDSWVKSSKGEEWLDV